MKSRIVEEFIDPVIPQDAQSAFESTTVKKVTTTKNTTTTTEKTTASTFSKKDASIKREAYIQFRSPELLAVPMKYEKDQMCSKEKS